MGSKFLRFRTNEPRTRKQYVVTDLGIISKAPKKSLPFFTFRVKPRVKVITAFMPKSM
jgi:hypothetical protein